MTNHRELKNKKYQKEIKKTIKDLKESKGDKTMEYMEYSTTNENTLMVRYKWKNIITGKETIFDYEVPYEMFMNEVRDYFDRKYDVKIDGKDNDIWNMLVDLGEQYDADIIQDLMDDADIQDNLTKKLEKDAKETFDELCHEEAEDEDDLEESYKKISTKKSLKEDYDDFDYYKEELDDLDLDDTTYDYYLEKLYEIADEDEYASYKSFADVLKDARKTAEQYKEDEFEDEYDFPEIEAFFRVYFRDKDGDELYAVDDGDYDFESTYDTKEAALAAMKKILQDPKVKADPEIGGCHSVFIADEQEWDEDPEGNYATYGYEPFEVVDEVEKR